MRIFKNKWFARFARKENISDASLRAVVRRIESGNVDAELGAGVYKQRLARPGEGQSGGYRIILCFKAKELTFFVYGFAKSDRDTLLQDEVKIFKKLAGILLSMSDQQIASMLKSGDFIELSGQGERP